METIEKWVEAFNILTSRVGLRFANSKTRRCFRAYMQGLLQPVKRKNSWQLAESLEQSSPYRIQQFLYRSEWSADEVRDDLRQYVIQHLADPEGVLVIDETGFPKKGHHSAGVQPQYCGCLGRVANCQVGVFLTYATPNGHTFVDRDLYLPQSWLDDRPRCQVAGIPADVSFATKPELAQQMLTRVLGSELPVKWVTADSVYGGNCNLTFFLERIPLAYVMAISPKDTVILPAGFPEHTSLILADLDNHPEYTWVTLSAGAGSKGERLFDWLVLPLFDPEAPGFKRFLLIRRSLSKPDDLTPYLCFAPAATTLNQLVQVAGTRWQVEQSFEMAKQEVGLADYELRSYQGWYRHITLACLAHAFLAVLRTQGLDPLDELQKKGPLATNTTSLTSFKLKCNLSSP
jgi:SRSO17 transposase